MHLLISCLLICVPSQDAQQKKPDERKEPVLFSGPQVGEKLPALMVRTGGGQEPIDVVKQHGGNPLVVIFLHKLTRPGFATSNVLAKFGAERQKDKLRTVVVMLTDDEPATEKQLANITRLLPKQTTVGTSPAGAEGPGAYGLNRNVLVTVLVAKDGKVQANYALGQPSANVDGQKILKSIVDTLGGGDVPKVSKYLANRRGTDVAPRMDPQLQRLVRSLMQEDLTDEAAAKQISAVQKYVTDKPAKKTQLYQLAASMTRANRRVKNAKANQQLLAWAKQAPPAMRSRDSERGAQQDPNIRGLLSPLIQKTATDEDVIAAAFKIEEYAAKNPKSKIQIGDICRRIIAADKLSNYGTAKCQEFMTMWSKDFVAQKMNEPAKPKATQP